MKNEIIIKELNPEDSAQLPKLMKKVWHRDTTDAYWRWKFFECPFDKKGIVFQNKAGNIVGFNAFWIRPTRFGQNTIFPWQSTDTLADPQYRGGQMFLSIINILVSELRQQTMVFGWPNPTAFKLFSTFLPEFRRVETSMPVFLAIMNMGSFVRLPRWIHNIINSLSRLTHKLRLSCPSLSKISVRKTTKIGDEFDQLWQDISGEYVWIQERKKDYLTWRFLRAPYREYQIWKALENDRLIGYLVTTIKADSRGFRGFLVDWLVSRKRDDVFKIMIKTAMEWFLTQKVDAVETWLFDHEDQWTHILRLFLFMKIKRKEYFLATGEESIDQKKLFLTLGDSDRI
jgi:hypothetical protein